MNIALIGSGGREHALCKKIYESKLINKIVCFPGNAGTANMATNVEVDILDFLQKASKKKFKIVLPVIKSKSKMSFKLWFSNEPLYVSKFGILEPHKSNKEIIPDLIMVPLVAFDKQLNRIGYGKGYYDRILSRMSKKKDKLISVGIANSFQQCKNIPANKYDFKLDYIFTDQGIIN